MAVYEQPGAALAAECFGTFMLVLVGTGAVVYLGDSGNSWAPLAIAAAFGGVVWAMVGLFGPISRAHINPAVTVAFWIAGDVPARLAVGYLTVQLLGASLASVLLYALVPDHGGFGATLPAVSPAYAIAIEAVLTLGLMSVILWVVNRPAASSWHAGAAIGGWVAMAAWFAGAWTGASMNPARSFGPALVSGTAHWLWLYWLAPMLGAALAVWVCRLSVAKQDCCRACMA